MCLTSFWCQTSITVDGVFFVRTFPAPCWHTVTFLSRFFFLAGPDSCVSLPYFTSTWSVTSQISQAVLSSSAAGYRWHSAHRPVCQHNINIRSLTSFTSTVPWCNLWERLSCAASGTQICWQPVSSGFPPRPPDCSEASHCRSLLPWTGSPVH